MTIYLLRTVTVLFVVFSLLSTKEHSSEVSLFLLLFAVVSELMAISCILTDDPKRQSFVARTVDEFLSNNINNDIAEVNELITDINEQEEITTTTTTTKTKSPTEKVTATRKRTTKKAPVKRKAAPKRTTRTAKSTTKGVKA